MLYSLDMGRELDKGKGASPFLTVRTPRALLDALERLAASDRRTLSDYVRLVLADHVAAKRKKKGGR